MSNQLGWWCKWEVEWHANVREQRNSWASPAKCFWLIHMSCDCISHNVVSCSDLRTWSCQRFRSRISATYISGYLTPAPPINRRASPQTPQNGRSVAKDPISGLPLGYWGLWLSLMPNLNGGRSPLCGRVMTQISSPFNLYQSFCHLVFYYYLFSLIDGFLFCDDCGGYSLLTI